MDDQDADDVAEARKLYDRGVFYLSCGLAAEDPDDDRDQQDGRRLAPRGARRAIRRVP